MGNFFKKQKQNKLLDEEYDDQNTSYFCCSPCIAINMQKVHNHYKKNEFYIILRINGKNILENNALYYENTMYFGLTYFQNYLIHFLHKFLKKFFNQNCPLLKIYNG